MSCKIAVSKELSESIKSVLGRNVKVSLKCPVRMETKGDKTEAKLLVFSACRLFVMARKVPTKLDQHFHYLEITSIESKKCNQLCLTVGDRSYTFYPAEGDDDAVDKIMLHLMTALRTIFPGVPLPLMLRKIDMLPEGRLQPLFDAVHAARDSQDSGPCGGFSIQYACMCDYHGLPYREEVAWDVDTIYLSHDTKQLTLQDFDHLEPRDLVPIISALEYNTWFTKLRASNVRLVAEAAEQILRVMRNSLSIEELYLDNVGIRWEFVQKLSASLVNNPSSIIHTIDLSGNIIEDKGINQLGPALQKLPKGLVHLNLAKTGLSSKGVNALATSLGSNRFMPATLSYLNLADNVLKEDVNNLYNFLAQPNALTHLDVSGTDINLDTLFGALLRGCCQKLSHINLARNMFNHKRTKDLVAPASFKQFFLSTLALKYLNLSSTRLSHDTLKNLLLGLACNESISEVELDLSSNSMGTAGALVMEHCLSDVRSLASLDIADNGLEADMTGVMTAICKNKSLRRLSIGRNFSNIKNKHMAAVMESVVQLVQEDDGCLEHLSLADSKLKMDVYNVINALGSNQSLLTVDISGNQMGDGGARLLAKALQINNRLRALFYDKNNITAQGLSDLAFALETNHTLRFMPFPLHDAVAAMKASPERTEAALKRIEHLVHRNVSPKKFSHGQAFRLQQGFLLNSTHQMVDRLVVQTQDLVRELRLHPDTPADILHYSDELWKDADNSKQLLTRLHDVALQRQESGNSVELKLTSSADDLHRVVQGHLQGTVDSMLKCAEDRCPLILSDTRLRDDLATSGREKSSVTASFVRQCIVEQAGTDILNRVNELHLAVAAHLSDKICDEVMESLGKNYKALLKIVNNRQNSSPVLRRRSRSDSNTSKAEKSDSPDDTPQLNSKRRSVQTRKLRPQSVVDNSEGMILELNTETLPKQLEEDETLDESGDGSPQQLKHLAKSRPRRLKTRAGSRSAPCTPAIPEHQPNLGEGLDQFFTPASPANSPAGSDDKSVDFGKKQEKKPTVKETKSDDADKEKKDKGAWLVQGLSNMFSRKSQERHSRTKIVDQEQDKGVVLLSTSKTEADLTSSPILPPKPNDDGPQEETPPPRPPSAIPRIGVGSNLLAEMKARQEKRFSMHGTYNKLEENDNKEQATCNSSTSSPLIPSQIRSSSKPSTNGIAGKSANENAASGAIPSPDLVVKAPPRLASGSLTTTISTPPVNRNSEYGLLTADQDNRSSLSFKSRPPPPIAPKPRPRSVLGMSGDFSPGSDHSSTEGSAGTTPERTGESTDSGLMGSRDSLTPPSPRSSIDLDKETVKRKTASLPRNITPDSTPESIRSRSISYRGSSPVPELPPRRPLALPSECPASVDKNENDKLDAFVIDDIVDV